MALVELRMTFADLGALEREIATNLRHGRAFLNEAADVKVLSDCALVLVHPEHGAELKLPAQVVMVASEGPVRGTGIEVRPWSPTLLAQVEAFPYSPPPPAPEPETTVAPEASPPPSAAGEAPVEEAVQAAPQGSATVPSGPPDVEPPPDGTFDAGAESAAASEGTGESAAEGEGEDPPDDPELDAEIERELAAEGKPVELQSEDKRAKLRHLNVTEQLKIARKGELADRIAVERLYGKTVWEGLLHNPRLTIPEVARIARKGTVPKPLLELILDNNTWIRAPQVRRALMTNPKCGMEAIAKILRTAPKHELKVIAKSTAYTQAVREAANKLLKQ